MAAITQHPRHRDTGSHPRAALDVEAVRGAYRRWAAIYDSVFGGVSAAGRRRAVAAVNQFVSSGAGGRPLRVLEVGVGTGLALPHYRREIEVVGIDLSREMLERARERIAAERLTNVRGLLEMDAERMAFRDGVFDVAAAMFTASVVPNAKRLFAEMSRVVRPGGTLLFVNHFAVESGLRWWMERSMAPLARVLGWHPDFRLTDLLDPARVPVEAIEPCPPAGLFSLVRVRNAGAPAVAAAA